MGWWRWKLDQQPEADPLVAATQIVDWNAFAPDSVKVGTTITVLPENVVFAADVLNVESSSLAHFLIAYEKLKFKMLGLLTDMI